MMKKKIFLAGLTLLLLFAAGCADEGPHYAGNESSAGPNTEPALPPPAPEGMLLGGTYVSALGEPCYEAYSTPPQGAQPQAYCLRQGQWSLAPQIFMTVPASPLTHE